MNLSERRKDEKFTKPPEITEEQRKWLMMRFRSLLKRFESEDKSIKENKD